MKFVRIFEDAAPEQGTYPCSEDADSSGQKNKVSDEEPDDPGVDVVKTFFFITVNEAK